MNGCMHESMIGETNEQNKQTTQDQAG